jgi:ribosomal peptide maturation radical SAM protein 1
MIGLVCMPFVSIKRPSLALGTLKSCLEKDGLRATIEYGNLDFAREIGITDYGSINIYPAPSLLGEWVFAGVLFPDFHPDHEAYLRSLNPLKAGLADHAELSEIAWRCRRSATEFVDRFARELIDKGYRIIGCTSTFEQNVASLALLKRVRELDPSIVTLMGGANCEGPMGVAMTNHFPWVDYVVSGEADDLIGPLCHSILQNGRDVKELPVGVLSPRLPPPDSPPRASILDMRKVPTPNYDDYFAHIKRLGFKDILSPGLAIETSRGCWWGAKHHCTFCGLNGYNMGFRSRTPEQALEQFHELAERYDCHQFMVADNILDMGYFKTVLPALAEAGKGYEIFYETKANLKRHHLELLAAAGVRWIQPGLETLNDNLLQLMDKGTTTLQNLQTLKWSRELGINVTWLLLFSFPGDELQWYEEIRELLPLISHFQPPNGLIQVGYHRFSPYFEKAKDYGIDPVPDPAYFSIYPFPEEQVSSLAYYFEDRSGTPRRAEVLDLLGMQFARWRHRFWDQAPILSLADDGTKVNIIDTRGEELVVRCYDGLDRRLLLACDAIISMKKLAQILEVSREDLQLCTERLERDGVIVCRNELVLGLGVVGEQPSLTRTLPDGVVNLIRLRAGQDPLSGLWHKSDQAVEEVTTLGR